ncbi:hypothetical protein CUMW_015070 [Citrus unshiu]|nr:hypothetical protein CUMW_015070 [Citrus unshiu]
MASLQASNLLFPSKASSNRIININAAISVPKLTKINFPVPALIRKPASNKTNLAEELKLRHRDNGFTEYSIPIVERREYKVEDYSNPQVEAQFYAILEAIADRVEMHKNVGEQRDNWNNLLLNSINMIILTAATMSSMAGLAGGSLLALNLPSTLLFFAATGMLIIMNKIQPSQLAEEQRNATKLFKELQGELQTLLALRRRPSEDDVKEATERVLALDKAYPLPLLGKMIEKFPKTFEPAVWWPEKENDHQLFQRNNKPHHHTMKQSRNGWSEELEMEMREIVKVLRSKDTEDYVRLGNLGLKINKTLAISGPLLTGIAAVGSAFVGTNSPNCAGFFTLLEESIESTLNESDVEKRENGEMFEMKVALQLGRSVSELRDLAKRSSLSELDDVLLFSSPSSSSISYNYCSSNRINASISLPKVPKIRFSPSKKPSRDHHLVEEPKIGDDGFTKYSIPIKKVVPAPITISVQEEGIFNVDSSMATAQLYAILEAVADRVEMHNNIGEQRDNWNTLLLNSINMITLTAATMAGLTLAAGTAGAGGSLLALKLSSTLLFSAATGMLVIMNKIQPSQLAEEQRNATKLFKQLQRELQTLLALRRRPSEDDVKEVTEKVSALDKAYPLPLLGKMIEKFPKTFEPAVWWPEKENDHHQFQRNNKPHQHTMKQNRNGWSEELEIEMRQIVEVLKSKDTEDYARLGSLGLKINKTLAISGPLLTGIAAVGSAFVGTNSSWAAAVAAVAGALAATVNTLEHGGQVGMVVEMYRNCAGFFKLLEESIESTLNESDVGKRENGEMFEMKVALQLGRSVSELRDLAKRSSLSELDEFASKLF